MVVYVIEYSRYNYDERGRVDVPIIESFTDEVEFNTRKTYLFEKYCIEEMKIYSGFVPLVDNL